jgi:hypothetical protein
MVTTAVDQLSAIVVIWNAVGLFASVIKSGERWSEQCEEAYQDARVALLSLPSPAEIEVMANRLDSWSYIPRYQMNDAIADIGNAAALLRRFLPKGGDATTS